MSLEQMNEYNCACGEVVMRKTMIDMLDAVAKHTMECPEADIEANQVSFPSHPQRRPYPTRARYRGEGVTILGYAGGGDFMVKFDTSEAISTVHRRHLTFTR